MYTPLRLAAILGLLGGCATPGAAETMARALHLAAEGDPEALAWCQALSLEAGRGSCEVAASRSQPDREAACRDIEEEAHCAECWFVYAEDLWTDERWDEAIVACRNAGLYATDCARHLWWESQAEATPQVTAAVVAAFPEAGLGDNTPGKPKSSPVDPADDPDRPVVVRPEMAEGERANAAVEAEAAANRERMEASKGADAWGNRLRDAPTLDASTCPEAEWVPCTEGARRVFRQRWTRALEQPQVRDELCAGGAISRPRLLGNGWAELEAEVERLRAENCGTPGQEGVHGP